MNDTDFDRIARQWLAEGPDALPDRSFAAAFDRINQLPRRRLAPRQRSLRMMSRTWQLAAGAAASIILVAGGALLVGRLGPGIAPTAAPTLTPGPPRLVYTQHSETDFATFTSDLGGGNIRPLVGPPSSHAHWSPDGSRIWVSTITWDRGGEPRIPGSYAATVKPDGSDFREFSQPQGTPKFLFCLAWSPDATRIACSGQEGEPALTGVYTVRTADGQEPVRLTSAPAGFADIPGDYSPDGREIAFIRADMTTGDGTLWLMNADGSNQREISGSYLFDGLDGGSPLTVDWSPDGATILATRKNVGFLVSPDGAVTAINIPETAAGRRWTVHQASWSCDSERILFVTHREPNYLDDLDVLAFVEKDGTDLQTYGLQVAGNLSCGRPPA